MKMDATMKKTEGVAILKLLDNVNLQNYYNKDEAISDFSIQEKRAQVGAVSEGSSITRDVGQIVAHYRKLKRAQVGTARIFAKLGKKHYLIVSTASNFMTVGKSMKGEISETLPDEIFFCC